MPLADFLGSFLRNFSQNTAIPVMNEVSQLALGGQQGYAQQQENQRQAAQLAQQLNLHNTMTPYEAGQLQLSSNAQDTAKDAQGLDLFNMIARGGKVVSSDTPGSIDYAGNSILPPTPPAPFTYKPTPEDVEDHPYLRQFAGTGIQMDAKEFPTFLKDLGGLKVHNPENTIAYEQTMQQQLGSLVAPEDPMAHTYQYLIHDALHPPDGASPDYKRAMGVLDDVRKSQTEIALEKRKQDIAQSPEALQFAARKSGAEMSASLAAQQEAAAKLLPDSVMDDMYKRVKLGQIPIDQAARQLGLNDKFGRARWLNFLSTMGEKVGESDMPVQLDQPTRTRLQGLEPVIDSLVDLRGKLAAAGADKDNTPGSLLKARLLYGLGAGDASGGLISQLEMDRLRGAAQALPGGRAALQTFEQAQIHTPNAWKDSSRLAVDKIDTMLDYLKNQEHDMFKYGAKNAVVQSDEAATKQSPHGGARGASGGSGTTTAPPEYHVVNGQLVPGPPPIK